MVAVDRWDALGGWCEVLTVRSEDLPQLSELARSEIAALDEACSRLGHDSDVAGMTREPSEQAGPLLTAVLAAVARTDEFTDGLLGPDVGATAKAWAADWIADTCVEELGFGCLVNLGGNIAVRGEVPAGGWQVEIDDGHAAPQGHPVISMGWPGGLATASATGRTWRTVTVAARSCERADAASRAALVLGDSAPRWLTQRELPARLVHTGGVVVQTNGWPRQRWIA